MSLISIKPEIQKVVDQFSGVVGYTIYDETAGEQIDWNETMIMPTASTCKVFALVKLLKMVDEGKLSLDDKVELNETNMCRGSGVLKEVQFGAQFTLHDACMLMVIISDNSATNMVFDACGGVDAINEYIASLGIKDCVVYNRMDFAKIFKSTDLAVASSSEFVKLLRMVRAGNVLSPAMTEKFMLFLSKQQCVGQFPRYMHYNQYAPETYQPCNVRVYSKTGFMVQTRVDVGYIEKDDKWVTYAVFTTDSDDYSFDVENEGEVTIGKIGKLVYDEILA